MRRFADITMRPAVAFRVRCLASLVAPQPGAVLWYDTSDIAALRQGEKERADTLQSSPPPRSSSSTPALSRTRSPPPSRAAT
jgi:hypothetical protein